MTDFSLRRRAYLLLSAGAVTSVAGCQENIDSPPDFEVTSVDAPDEATQGETITVSATVTNTGGRSGDGTVTVGFSDSDSTEESFDLDVDESHVIEAGYEVTQSEDFSIEIETDGSGPALDDSTETTVAVSVSADDLNLDVSGPSTSASSVLAGESFTVSATVTNQGDTSALVDAELWREGSASASMVESLALDAGESTSVEFEYDVDDPGSYALELRLAHDQVSGALASGTVDVTVRDPAAANFSIDYLRVSDSVVVDDSEFVRINVANGGDESGTATVELTVDGETVHEESIDVSDGGTEVARTRHTFDETGDASVEATVTDENGSIHDTESTTVEVRQPEDARFSVDIRSSPSSALLGEDDVEVDARVTNEGDESGSATVDLQFDGETVDTTTTGSLNAGSATTVSLSAVVEGEERTVDVTVETGGGSDSTTVEATEPTPTNFELERVEAPAEEVVSVAWQAELTVANTGQSTGTTTLALSVGGSVVDETDVEIPGGESTTLALQWNADEPGDYEFAITTRDDERTGAMTILDAQHPEVTLGTARDDLAAIAADLIETIETDFANFEVGSFDRGTVGTSLQDVENRLAGADADIDQFESDGRIDGSEAERLRSERVSLDATRNALVILADSMDEYATAVSGYDEIVVSVDAGDFETGLAALTGDGGLTDALAISQANRDRASSRLDDVDDGWLSSFDDDVSASTSLEGAVDSGYADVLDSFEDRVGETRLELAAIPLAEALNDLAGVVGVVGDRLDSEFGSEPWTGVSLNTGPIDDLSTDEQLSDADEAIGDVDASGTEVGTTRTQLGILDSAVRGLGEAMDPADTAFTRATDAAAVIGLSESDYQNAQDAIDDASDAIGDANGSFSSADGERGSLDAGWIGDTFDPAVDGHSLSGVFGTFDDALDATDVLVDGMDTLIGSGTNVVSANGDYDSGSDAFSSGDYDDAASSFDDAAGEFRTAQSKAEDAERTLSDGAGDLPSDLALLLDVAVCKAGNFADAAGLFVDAANLAADAANAAADGDQDEADSLMDDAESKGQSALSAAESSCP